eukprot:3473511-Prymnesium_polylepis.1
MRCWERPFANVCARCALDGSQLTWTRPAVLAPPVGRGVAHHVLRSEYQSGGSGAAAVPRILGDVVAAMGLGVVALVDDEMTSDKRTGIWRLPSACTRASTMGRCARGGLAAANGKWHTVRATEDGAREYGQGVRQGDAAPAQALANRGTVWCGAVLRGVGRSGRGARLDVLPIERRDASDDEDKREVAQHRHERPRGPRLVEHADAHQDARRHRHERRVDGDEHHATVLRRRGWVGRTCGDGRRAVAGVRE